MTGPLRKYYDENARCPYHMNTVGQNTNNCWAHWYKIQDLIDNGIIAVAPPAAQDIGTNPLPSYVTSPLGSSVNIFSIEEFPIDQSQLIAPTDITVCVRIMKSNVPLVALVNYSRPIIHHWWPCLVSLQSSLRIWLRSLFLPDLNQ